jgi:hypothetical protein
MQLNAFVNTHYILLASKHAPGVLCIQERTGVPATIEYEVPVMGAGMREPGMQGGVGPRHRPTARQNINWWLVACSRLTKN